MKSSCPVDVEALAVRLAVLRAQHQQADELEGRRRSRAAFRRWKERLPMELREEGDVELLVDRHRTYWLRSASGFVRSIDPRGLGASDFHVLDFADFGLASDTVSGLAFPEGAFELFADILPRGARPGPVVAVNVQTQARHHTRRILETATELSLRETVRVGITATVLHEAAHVLDWLATGVRIPAAATVDMIRQSCREPSTPDVRASTHGEGWVRAFGHLAFRSAIRPPADYWSKVFAFDVEQHYEGPGDEVLDALVPELVSASTSSPLIDAIRSPYPASFGRLLAARRKPQE